MKLSKYLILSLFIMASLSACSKVGKVQEGISVMDYNNPKKVCFGRIEMIVPKETEVKYSDFNYNYSDLEVDESIKTYEAYQKLVHDKIQSLKNQPHEKEGSLLTRDLPGSVKQSNRSISHIVVFRNNKYTDGSYDITGYLYLGPGKLLVLKSAADNELLDEALEEMLHNMKSIKIKSPNEISAGLCWKEFFIVDDMSQNRPFIGGYLHFKFPSYPGVRVDVKQRIRLESDIALIELVRRNYSEVPLSVKAQLKIEHIREDKKEINGLAGEEVLNYISERGVFERGFEDGTWQYLGKLENYNDPYIQFKFESAEMINPNESFYSSISQKNALKLYDFILNSLQISPNNKKD